MSNLTQEVKFSKTDYSVADANVSTTGFGIPKYNFSKVVPSTGQSCSATDTAVVDTTFRIPTVPYLPSKSYIHMKLVTEAPSGAGHQVACNLDAPPLIEGLNCVTESGTVIINKLQNLREYLKVINPRQTNMKDYLSSDPSTTFYPSWQSSGTGGSVATNTAQNIEWTGTTGALTTQIPSTDSSSSYYENKHFEIGADNTALTMYINIPLSMFKNTFLATPKNVLFPEIVELTLQLGYTGRSFVDITTSTGAVIAYDDPVTVSELALYLCVDENKENEVLLKAMEAKEGLKLHIPVVDISMKSEAKSTSFSQQLVLNRTKGYRLRKIYIAPFTHDLNAGNYLDNSNISGAKIANFYTQFNNKRRQNYDIDCKTAMQDFKEYRAKHESGDDAIVSRNYFYYNFAILDEFDGGLPVNSNISGGEVLTSEQYTYDYIGTSGNFALTYGRFIIYERDMVITSTGVAFI